MAFNSPFTPPQPTFSDFEYTVSAVRGTLPGLTTKARQEALAGQSNWGSEGSYTPSFKLVPQDSGSFKLEGKTTFNIVNDFRWTYSNFREEVPRILLVERQILANQQLSYYFGTIARLALAPGSDPYQDLYSLAQKTGFEYILPYFSNQNIAVGSAWSETSAEASSLGSQLSESLSSSAAAVAKAGLIDAAKKSSSVVKSSLLASLAGNIPGSISSVVEKAITIKGAVNDGSFTGIEQPLYFSNNKKTSFKVTFPLFNTTSVEDIRRNYDFIRVFGYQNSYDRKTFSTYNPPVMYECKFVNGYMGEIGERPALYVESFNVQNVGSIKSIDIGIGTRLAVPEAYLIEINLVEMLAMSKSIFSSYFTGGTIVNVY